MWSGASAVEDDPALEQQLPAVRVRVRARVRVRV